MKVRREMVKPFGWIVTRELRGTFGLNIVQWFWNGQRWTKDVHKAKMYGRIEAEDEVDRQVTGRSDDWIRQNIIVLHATTTLMRD